MDASLLMVLSNPTTKLETQYSKIPAELWLQILEVAAVDSAEHTWTTVRTVCHQLEDHVERVFKASVLPTFAISLSLPRRDPVSGILRWTAVIPATALILSFHHLDEAQQFAFFKSLSVLPVPDGDEAKTLEAMRDSNDLPKERLMEAPAWVFYNSNFMSGRYMKVPKCTEFNWSEEHKAWVWKIEWRKLLTHFYGTKMKARLESAEGKRKGRYVKWLRR